MNDEQRCTWDDRYIDTDDDLKDMTEEEKREEFNRLYGEYLSE